MPLQLAECEACHHMVDKLHIAEHRTKCQIYGGPIDQRKKKIFKLAKESSLSECGNLSRTYENFQKLISAPKVKQKTGPKPNIMTYYPADISAKQPFCKPDALLPHNTINIQNVQNNIQTVQNTVQVNKNCIINQSQSPVPFNEVRINDLTDSNISYASENVLKWVAEVKDSYDKGEYYRDEFPAHVVKNSNMVANFHDEIHYNPNHPENRSIKTRKTEGKRKNDGYDVFYLKKGKWVRVENQDMFYRSVQKLHERQICDILREILTDLQKQYAISDEHNQSIEVIGNNLIDTSRNLTPEKTKEVAQWFINAHVEGLRWEKRADKEDLYNRDFWSEMSRLKMQSSDKKKGLPEAFSDYFAIHGTDEEYFADIIAEQEAAEQKLLEAEKSKVTEQLE